MTQTARKFLRLITTLVLLAAGSSAFAQGNLSLEVFTSTPHGYEVTSTLIYGANGVLLIDPQFLLPEAAQVVEMIRKSGKPLEMIYTTHAHPDHFLGVAEVLKAFPGARYVALPEVRERMITSWPGRRNFWYPTYGDELPGEEAILPEALAAPELVFEGHHFPITSEQVGLDGAGNSFVYIPELAAVVAGDIIFNSHLRPPVDTAPVFATFARIAALQPRIIVAGHQAKGAASDAGVIDFIKGYIEYFHAAKAESGNAEELIARMKEQYPGLGRVDALEQAANTAFAAATP